MIVPDLRALIALLCSELLIANLVGCGRQHRVELPTVKPVASVFEPLQEDLKKSYLTLFETAPGLEYSEAQVARMREYLNQAQDFCGGGLKLQIPRRTNFQDLIQKTGGMGIAIDNNCAIQFRDGQVFKVLVSKSRARAYRVFTRQRKVVEEQIAPD
jgi:hypothetical protein